MEVTTLTDFDLHLMGEGTDLRIYEKLGAHLMTVNGRSGVRFAVWAPNAEQVCVVGDFNEWNGRLHAMHQHSGSGIWELFIPDLGQGTVYKYEIQTHYKGYRVNKTDPVGFASELRPANASVVWDLNQFEWNDKEWLAQRAERNGQNSPISIYEVHLGSWRRKDGDLWLSYAELAEELIPYVQEMGYTHIELLPITEYPYDGSWGYQVTGYFAPTSRFGTPDDFKAFVDACHQANIGVILDWVPAHFPTDQHGLGFFDGTHLYEHADPRRGAHPDWGTYIFNYGRYEVAQFLVSNALFWIEKYHLDGLRVDAVASMLYLDFSRQPGEWLPNRYGGRENIEAIAFIRRFNEQLHEHFPDVITIAEESTSWPGVTASIADGGLGFDFKWNMGWMHDTLQYIQNDPVYRAYHHGTLAFSLMYAFSENFMLPFSHDEVVHLKRSMLDKMTGDLWQKFANLRLLYGYQWGHPGKKLTFMGAEFGQWQEWSEERSLDWHLLNTTYPYMNKPHRELQSYVRDLNKLYQQEATLHQEDNSWDGFQWVDFQDGTRSILAFARIAPKANETMLVICNFTPMVREAYRLGVPAEGSYVELLNSDDVDYGGSGVVNKRPLFTTDTPWHDQTQSITLTLPPLGIVFLKQKE
ncbi:MAG: 1,4-alpha-glucan branching protein GlgB [Chloroflexota bacterium]